MWYYLFKYIFMGLFFMLFGCLKVEGLEYILSLGLVIFVSNYFVVVDSFYFLLVVCCCIWFLVKLEYFIGIGLKGWINCWFYSVFGQVFIDCINVDFVQGVLQMVVVLLGQGKLLGMYLEGICLLDGWFYKGKIGLVWLVLYIGVLVILVVMIGINVVNLLGRKMLRFGRVIVWFGKLMDFFWFEGLVGNYFIEWVVIDEVIYELMGFLGQEYVDIYVVSVKDGCNVGGVGVNFNLMDVV